MAAVRRVASSAVLLEEPKISIPEVKTRMRPMRLIGMSAESDADTAGAAWLRACPTKTTVDLPEAQGG